MRIFISLILILVLSLTLVAGIGEIEKIDFLVGDTLVMNVALDSGVEFELFNDRHVIVVDKITYKGVDLDIFLFVNGDQKTAYSTATQDKTVKVDVNKDGNGDIFIGLQKVLGEKEARLVFYKPIQNLDGNEITGEVINIENSSTEVNIGSLIFGVIFIILVIILVVMISINSYKKDKE